jgi:hypothetical protein
VRRLVFFAALSMKPYPAAAQCPIDLHNRSEEASTHLVRFMTYAERAKNMQQKHGAGVACRLAERMPAILKTAREYFSVCDVIGGQRALPAIAKYQFMIAKLREAECKM